MRALGMTTVASFCEAQGCGHDAVISLEGWPKATPIPDIALRLRCSECGSRKIRMMLNVREMYAKAYGVAPPKPLSWEMFNKEASDQHRWGMRWGCCELS